MSLLNQKVNMRKFCQGFFKKKLIMFFTQINSSTWATVSIDEFRYCFEMQNSTDRVSDCFLGHH